MSIGSVRARQQFDIDNAADQLTKNAISQAKESLDITKKTAATKIQSAVRNRNARHELDKNIDARIQRGETDVRRLENTMAYIRPSTTIQNAALSCPIKNAPFSTALDKNSSPDSSISFNLCNFCSKEPSPNKQPSAPFSPT